MSSRIGCSAVLGFFIAAQGLAQDYSRVAPKSLPGSGSGEVAAPPPPQSSAPSQAERRTILDRLLGLRLVDTAAKIVRDGAHQTGITLSGLDVLTHGIFVQHLRDAYIGRPLTQESMMQISADIQNWYRSADRPFVQISFPEQDISTGVVQVLVIEYRRGRVIAEGNEWFADSLLTNRITAVRGEPIYASQLSDDLVFLNQNPFRQTAATVEFDKVSGEANIVLHTDDRFPVRFYATYDNEGVPSTGVNRYGLGVLWGNAFDLDQQLSYQFTSSDDFWGRPGRVAVEPGGASMAAHSASDIISLPWRDTLTIFGLYEQDRPPLGNIFSETGVSWQASARYDTKFAPMWAIQSELQWGFDFKHTNNNFAFFGFNISKSATEIAQFPVLLAAALADGWGQTQLSNLTVLSPGRLSADNNDEAFRPSFTHFGVPDARARYAYDDVTLSRINRLPFDFTAILRGQAQISTSNLLPSEQLDAGGIDSVRGYDERTAEGSLGWQATAEVRTPPFGPLNRFAGVGVGDALQFDAFWDSAHVRNNQIAAGPPAALESVGCGAHYTLGRFIDLRLENGWQVRKAPTQTRRSSRLIFSVVVGS